MRVISRIEGRCAMRQNVYQMYEENGNRVGFWVSRPTWGHSAAYVLSIGGQVDRALQGDSPYYDNPKVYCRFYTAEGPPSGERQLLRYPGSYTYDRITPSVALALLGWKKIVDAVGQPLAVASA
jgi:hypothetical protein